MQVIGGADEEEFLVGRMGKIGGESNDYGGESGESGVGLTRGRAKVEFEEAEVEGPSHERDPTRWIRVTNAEALCCSAINGGAKFCVAPADDYSFQIHQKRKALIRSHAVYLTVRNARGRGKLSVFTSWYATESVFGELWDELEGVRLSPHYFHRFGDTLKSMFDDGQDPAGFDWTAVALSVLKPLQVGPPKRFKIPPLDQATLTVDSALKMWIKLGPEEEDADGYEERAFGSMIQDSSVAFDIGLL
jgi:hypothetical protein